MKQLLIGSIFILLFIYHLLGTTISLEIVEIDRPQPYPKHRPGVSARNLQWHWANPISLAQLIATRLFEKVFNGTGR